MEKKFKLVINLVQNEIREQVAKNKLHKALDFLYELAELCGEDDLNDVIILRRRVNAIEDERFSGRISFKEAEEICNRLATGILGVAKNMSN